MTQSPSLMNSFVNQNSSLDGTAIPQLGHREAEQMARNELDRFLTLVDSLSGPDWDRPTDCTEWTVRDIVAHQAGAYAGYTRWREFFHQMSAKPAPGRPPIDGINARQIADRSDRSPAELVAELQEVGPRAIRTRARLPWLLRKLPIPFGPPLHTVPVGYLTDLIYTRDTWSHRLDISRAARLPFKQTANHDGRIVALVVRDLSQILHSKLGGQSVVFDLTGPAGGRYHIGLLAEPTAIIKMDTLVFNRLASDRLSAEDMLEQEAVAISGDRGFAQHILEQTSVPY